MANLGYVILYVPSVSQAVEFYTAAFGLAPRFVHESGSYAEMETGATALAFAEESMAAAHHLPIRPNRPTESAPAIEIALVDSDVSALFERAVAVGATGVESPSERPWGQTVAYVRDLNGVLVELCSPMGAGD